MNNYNLTEFNPMLANAERIRFSHESRQAFQSHVDSVHENMSNLDMFRQVFPGFPDQSRLNGMFDMLKQSGFMPSAMVDQAQGIFNKFSSGETGGFGNNPIGALVSLSGGIK